MALKTTCDKCKMFLLKFKREICRNPDTDVTPYTHMLAVEFRKWNDALEKEFIGDFFLELYAQDAQSLKRDLCELEPRDVLCKLMALNTAKARFPERGLLTGCIQGAILPQEFSRLIEVWSRVGVDQIRHETDLAKYEIDRRKYDYEQILLEFKKEICRNSRPVVDIFEEYINNLAQEYSKMEYLCEERLIKTLFLNLYGEDTQSLKRVLTKALTNSTIKVKAAPANRTVLLKTLYGALSSYIGEDLSWIIARCDKR